MKSIQSLYLLSISPRYPSPQSKQMPQSKLLTGQDFSSHQESRSKTAVQHLNLLYIIYFLLAPTMYNRTPIYRAKPFPLIIPVNRGPMYPLLSGILFDIEISSSDVCLHLTCVYLCVLWCEQVSVFCNRN
eukprot:sb/3475182/